MNERLDEIIQSVFRFDLLTKLPRTGFAMRGMTPPETIGSHIFSATVLATILLTELRKEGMVLDGEKLLKMAVLHESGEILIGDIPSPFSRMMGQELKQELEEKAGRRVLRAYPDLQDVISEFEAGGSLEAKIIKAVDKLQMMIKVMIYDSEQQGNTEDFWNYSGNFVYVGIPLIDRLFDRIKEQRGSVRLDYLELTRE